MKVAHHRDLTLRADGFSLSLLIRKDSCGHSNTVYGESRITCFGNGALSFTSRFSVTLLELDTLFAMISRHILDIRFDRLADEVTWIPLDLSFQVALLFGEIETHDGKDSGSISIRILVYSPNSDASLHRKYIGVEGVVDVNELTLFQSCLSETLHVLRSKE